MYNIDRTYQQSTPHKRGTRKKVETMELSKINSKLYGKSVTVEAEAPISIAEREKWLVKHTGMTPAEAHDTVHDIMAQAIYDAADAWWHNNIPDNMDLVRWIDIRYDINLFERLKGGDMS